MSHLLNNMSEEEKNSILEQHYIAKHKNSIKIAESQLEDIVKNALNEQSFPGTSSFENMGYRSFSTLTKSKEDINPKKLKLGDRDKPGDENGPVHELQRKLSVAADGIFGKLTNYALSQYLSKPEKKVDTSVNKKGEKVAKCETGTTKVLDPNGSLIFNGDELQWVASGSVVKTWGAVSGLTFKNAPPKDWGKMIKRYTSNPEEWSKDKNAGPIPPGKYLVGPLETRSGNLPEISALEAIWLKITGQVTDSESDRAFCKKTAISRISWGNYRLPITPYSGNKMYNRSDFYVHGGSLEGSHGCIDLTNNMEDFAKFFGIWSAATKNKKIPLVVNYKSPNENTFFAQLGKSFK